MENALTTNRLGVELFSGSQAMMLNEWCSGYNRGCFGMDIGQHPTLGMFSEGEVGLVYRARHKNDRVAKMCGAVAIKRIKGEYTPIVHRS